MLGAIIRKEIQTSVFSFRFLAVTVLLVLIVPLTTFVLTGDTVRQMADYSRRQALIENYLKNYAHFNRVQNVIAPRQPPLPIYALVRGLSADTSLDEFDEDPLPVMFPLLDLVFIVAVLLSLAALILAYDTVCGEKEAGTLKLMLANGVGRARILLGKVIGLLVTLLVPFALSLVLGLLVIALNPDVGWRGTDWAATACVLAGAAVYVFLFLALGVFLSTRHLSASSSIMTALFAWVLLILVIPNLSPYLASLLSPAPSRIQTARETSRLTDTDRDELGRRLADERLRVLQQQYPVLAERLDPAERSARLEHDPAFRQAYQAQTQAIQQAWDEANRIQGEKARQVREAADRKEEAQTDWARVLSMVSPLADFTYLATDLTSTGLRNGLHFESLAVHWDRDFAGYVRNRIASLQRQDPATDWWNTPVDVEDMPRFHYREEALSSRIQGVWPPLAVLAMMCLALLVSAYASFARYDVR
jgi:ABC-type transport system involved in multi-copper enzyme maturation permease subunit